MTTFRSKLQSVLVTAADWLDALALVVGPRDLPRDVCTGISASWCPVHGDCTCQEPCPDCGVRQPGDVTAQGGGAFYRWRCRLCALEYESDSPPRDSSWCALHGQDSNHGEDAA